MGSFLCFSKEVIKVKVEEVGDAENQRLVINEHVSSVRRMG